MRFLEYLKRLLALFLSLIAIIQFSIVGRATCLNGDVDNNNFISTADAKLALCYASHILTPTEYQKNAADVNRDGYINTDDAVIILKIASGVQKNFTHEYSDWEIVYESNCTDEGVAVCYCTICDESFTKVLYPTGHNFVGQSCTEAGFCENCGEEIPATGHNIVNNNCTYCDFSTKAPTITYKKKIIDFNSSMEDVVAVLGSPKDILTDSTNHGLLKILVYCYDYKNLGIFTFFNNRLSQFYTNSLSSVVEYHNKKYTLKNGNISDDILHIGDITINAYTDTVDHKIYSYLVTVGDNYNYTVTSDFTANEKLIFHLTNGCRAIQNITPLKYSQKAHTSAYKHSLDMATNNYFSHEGLNGSTPVDRMLAAGIDCYMYAENIAAGYPDAYKQNNGWYNSPGHRANMLVPELKYLGVGIAYKRNSIYQYYAIQNFFA